MRHSRWCRVLYKQTQVAAHRPNAIDRSGRLFFQVAWVEANVYATVAIIKRIQHVWSNHSGHSSDSFNGHMTSSKPPKSHQCLPKEVSFFILRPRSRKRPSWPHSVAAQLPSPSGKTLGRTSGNPTGPTVRLSPEEASVEKTKQKRSPLPRAMHGATHTGVTYPKHEADLGKHLPF